MGLHLIAATSWWLQLSSWQSIGMMAGGLGMLIFVHELGHFLVAKACGVKCEKFYLGFDVPFGKMFASLLKLEKPLPIPASIVKFTWGETTYGIGIVPLGGYVKMLGQDDNPAAAARERERIRIKKEEDAADSGKIGGGQVEGAPSTEGGEGDDDYVLDPRSYQAKSVPQRMAIISAGVIMNLLTAPLFAMLAFLPISGGVVYTPSVAGQLVQGGPAEQAGMRPGDRILQIGGHTDPYEHLRFKWDLMQGIAMSSEGQPLELLVRHKDGEEETITVKPMRYNNANGEPADRVSIGISMLRSTTLFPKEYWSPASPARTTTPPLDGGDKIVAVTPQGGTRQAVEQFAQLRKLLIEYADVPLKLEVERDTGKVADGKPVVETVEVTMPPVFFRDPGLVMKAGPIDSLRPGSPAEAAGLKKGDRIVSIAGEKFGGDGVNPMLLSGFLRQHFGKTIPVEVERDGKNVTLEVTPEVPETFGYFQTPGAPMTAAAIGVNYPVTLTVDYVVPDSPAAKRGLQADDKLLDLTILSASKDPEELARGLDKKVELDDDSRGWPFVWSALQAWPDNKFAITFQRDGKVQDAVKLTTVATTAPDPERGLPMGVAEEVQTADSIGEAFLLGLRQTKEDALRVVVMLKKLVTREIPATSLGGPGTIAAVATQQAGQGPATLLLFMTFLSVNLAIVNFLPIPVLDGGHMLFLIYEAIRGKPADEKWLTGLTLAGFCLLMCLMVFVIGLDIFRFSGLGA
ncbi:MAG: site-2 protease family protein [Pirellulaceae bacterium]